MPKITKNVFTAEEVLDQIFADQDSEEEENAADEALI